MDEGHLYRLRPCGTRKQILHSINLHLFAHPCCQWLLPREAAKVQERQSGLWSRLGLPYWLRGRGGGRGAFSTGLNLTGSLSWECCLCPLQRCQRINDKVGKRLGQWLAHTGLDGMQEAGEGDCNEGDTRVQVHVFYLC